MPQTRPLLIAGATGYGRWPANSLAGAVHCLGAPIDGIEIDVLLTADNQVVAHHDYRLSTDQTRLDGEWLAETGPAIKALTLDELRRYDVGRSRPGSDYAGRYPHRTETDAPIPTLPELLDLLRSASGPRRLFYIEIKTDPQDPRNAPAPEAIVDAVFRDVEAADYVDHTKIIAFDWQVLRLSRDRQPTVKTAHLTIPTSLAVKVKPGPDGRSPWTDGYDARDFDGSEMKAIKAHGGMEWSPYYTDVTPERMAEADALGLLVGPWGLSAGDDIRRMAELGVYSSTVSGADWGV